MRKLPKQIRKHSRRRRAARGSALPAYDQKALRWLSVALADIAQEEGDERQYRVVAAKQADWQTYNLHGDDIEQNEKVS